MTSGFNNPNLAGLNLPVPLTDAIKQAFFAIQALQSGQSGQTANVIQDTHAVRLSQYPAGAQTLGSIYVETDRAVIYVDRTVGGGNAWVYLAGQMYGTLVNLPSGLGKNDTGFLYLASDTYQEYRWSGTAWAEVTQANNLQYALASGTLTLVGGVYNDIPGCALTLARAGRYSIVGCFDFEGAGTLDSNEAALGRLIINSTTPLPGLSVFQPLVQTITGTGVTGSPVVTIFRSTIMQHWSYTAAAGDVASLQAEKTGGGGTSLAQSQSSISALWIGP